MVKNLLDIAALLIASISIVGGLATIFNLYYRIKNNLKSIEGLKDRVSNLQKDVSRIETYLIRSTDYAKKTGETYKDY